MRTWMQAFAVTALTVFGASLAHADSLQVAPVNIEMKAMSAATSLTLRNSGKRAIKAQIRVFSWSQVAGEEKLEPTKDIVASPPMATVEPGKDFVVRVVRLNPQPAASEETYRIIVDEIPGANPVKGSGLELSFRYSIPVFVASQSGGKTDLIWTTAKRDGKTVITATNNGDRHVRISDFKVADLSGKQATITKGLAGYVLARSSMSWVAPGPVQMAANGPILITAMGDQGAINAEARAEAAH